MNTFSLYGATVTRRTRRGTKAGRNVIRRVRVVTGVNKNVTSVKQTGANADNLIRCGNNISSLYGSFNINTRITNNFNRKSNLQRTCELANLIKIPTHSNQNSPCSVKLYSVNCRSVKNKALSICDLIVSNRVDIMAITETWLGSDVDNIVMSELVPNGYDIYHVPRKTRKGGGVALIYNNIVAAFRGMHVSPAKHSYA